MDSSPAARAGPEPTQLASLAARLESAEKALVATAHCIMCMDGAIRTLRDLLVENRAALVEMRRLLSSEPRPRPRGWRTAWWPRGACNK